MKNITRIAARFALILSLALTPSCENMLGDMGKSITSLRYQIPALLIPRPLPELALFLDGREINPGQLIDMGLALQDEAKTINLTMQNTGAATMTIAGIATIGTYADRFTVGAVALPANLAPGAQTTFEVVFRSTLMNDGYKSAVVSIDAGGDYAPFNVTVACERTEIPRAKLEVWRGKILVENNDLFDMKTAPYVVFMLKNTGTAEIVLNGIALDSGAPFTITSSPFPSPGSISINSSASIRVDLGQGAFGTFQDTLSIDYDDAVDPSCRFRITLGGMVQEPLVPAMVLRDGNGNTLSPLDEYDFGGLFMNGPGANMTFQIYNSGTGHLVIDSINIVNDNSEENFTQDGGPATIIQGGYAIFTVTYLPLEPGGHSATVTIDSNAGSVELDFTGHSLFHVAYSGNYNTGGDPPVDSHPYVYGQTVIVSGNSGNLVKTGHTFLGWNTAYNGSGISYLSGNTFQITDSMTLYAIWASSGSLDVTFNPAGGTPGEVSQILIQPDNKFIIRGSFNYYNGTYCRGLVRLNYPDGSHDTDFYFDSSLFAPTSIALLPDGNSMIANGNIYFFAQLDANGSLDPDFPIAGAANYQVKSILIQPDSKILFSGNFDYYDETSCHYIARLENDGTLDPGFDTSTGVDNQIHCMALQTDGKILIGGPFNNYNGAPRNRIARLNTDGTLDTTFDPGSGAGGSGWVNCIVIQPDGKILIGGGFTTYNGISRNRIARINSDGSLDTTFNPGTGANSGVACIAIQTDGKILIGGSFNSYNDMQCNNIARLKANGSLDTTFYTGTGPDSYVNSIAIQPDGRIMIGGAFTSFNGTTRYRMARLIP